MSPIGSQVREATGLDAAQRLLSEMYGKLRINPRDPQLGARIARVSVGRVELDDVHLAMTWGSWPTRD